MILVLVLVLFPMYVASAEYEQYDDIGICEYAYSEDSNEFFVQSEDSREFTEETYIEIIAWTEAARNARLDLDPQDPASWAGRPSVRAVGDLSHLRYAVDDCTILVRWYAEALSGIRGRNIGSGANIARRTVNEIHIPSGSSNAFSLIIGGDDVRSGDIISMRGSGRCNHCNRAHEWVSPVGHAGVVYRIDDDGLIHFLDQWSNVNTIHRRSSGHRVGCPHITYIARPPTHLLAEDPLPAPDREAIEQFVMRLFNMVLEREHDDAGLSEWTNVLSTRENTGAQVAYGFFFSPEMDYRDLSNAEFVNVLYRTLMDREADAEGHAAWAGQLNVGMPRRDVFAGFVNSMEFYIIAREAGIDRGTFVPPEGGQVRVFVTRLFSLVLQREPDTGGLNGWTNQLVTRQNSGADVAYGFFFSPEMRDRNLTDEQFVTILYNTLMDREPDPHGFAAWVGQLNGGESWYNVFVGFVMSAEFDRICREHNIDRGMMELIEVGSRSAWHHQSAARP